MQIIYTSSLRIEKENGKKNIRGQQKEARGMSYPRWVRKFGQKENCQ
jgi:hypothetical protein